MLTKMNANQLQVIINDLHAHVECKLDVLFNIYSNEIFHATLTSIFFPKSRFKRAVDEHADGTR